jgi:hypothetical protein
VETCHAGLETKPPNSDDDSDDPGWRAALEGSIAEGKDQENRLLQTSQFRLGEATPPGRFQPIAPQGPQDGTTSQEARGPSGSSTRIKASHRRRGRPDLSRAA